MSIANACNCWFPHHSGPLIAKVNRIPMPIPIPNAHGYEGQSAALGPDGVSGPWLRNDAGADSRKIEFNGLTPGVLHNLQVRAVGGSTGHSGWSNTVQHRSL